MYRNSHMQKTMISLKVASLFFAFILSLSSTHVLAENASVAAAINQFLLDSKKHFDAQEYERAAALLERALRIAPTNPILWHNLGGVRLQQEDWNRAASLAAKSNSFAPKNRWLRIRNWTLISLACKGMQDMNCVHEANKRAQSLLH